METIIEEVKGYKFNLICDGPSAEFEGMYEWLQTNCVDEWSMSVLNKYKYYNPTVGSHMSRIMIEMDSEDDVLLFKMRWQNKTVKADGVLPDQIAEPTFSMDDYNEKIEPISNTRSYLVGDMMTHNSANMFECRNLVKEVLNWCNIHLVGKFKHESPLFSSEGTSIIIGIMDEDDEKMSFMLKWEGHKRIKRVSWEWAPENKLS